MQKINTNQIPEIPRVSRTGKFERYRKNISEALGRDPMSTDLDKRHPFDVEICRIPAGKILCPFHSHSAQWEFYHVISGTGLARHPEGETPIASGDAFLFKPGEAHTLINNGAEDLVFYIIADNPIGESTHYPDSNKYAVRSPALILLRSESLDYYDGEE